MYTYLYITGVPGTMVQDPFLAGVTSSAQRAFGVPGFAPWPV